MSEPVIVTYVKYMSPGTIVTNETVREVLSRDPQRAAREARNPRTGEAIKVPAMKVPKFRAAKALKDAVK